MTTPPRPPPDDGAPSPAGAPPSKKDLATALLTGSSSMYVHLDPRKAEVIVPLNFKKQPQLVLQVGLNMAVQIPDLVLDDDGMTCTLSFDRRPFWCRVPWASVYALVGEDGKGMVWPNEVPSEVVASMQQQAQKPADQPRPAAKKRPKPRTVARASVAASEADGAAAPAPDGAAAAADGAKEPAPGAPPKRPAQKGKREIPPYLRVVK